MVLHGFALLIEKEDKDILRQIQGSGIRDSIPCPERYKEIQRLVSTSRCLLVFYAEISPLYHSISIQIFWVVVFQDIEETKRMVDFPHRLTEI